MDTLSRALHLRRFATFDCTVTLNELVDVPLVSGRFKVKWRFSRAVVGPQHYAQQLVDNDKTSGISAKVGDLLHRSVDEGQRAAAGEGKGAGDGAAEHGGTAEAIDYSLSNSTRRKHLSPVDSPEPRSAPRLSGESSRRNTPRASADLDNDASHSLGATPTGAQKGHGRNLSSTGTVVPGGREDIGRTPTAGSGSRFGSPVGSPRVGDGDYRSFSAAMSGSSPDGRHQHHHHPHQQSSHHHHHPHHPHPQHHHHHHHGHHHTASGGANELPAESAAGPPKVEVPTRADPHGQTDYTELRSHVVTFRQAFRCVVSVPIAKDGALDTCNLRLAVKEEGVDENGRRRTATHGEVHLDLAGLAPAVSAVKGSSRGEDRGQRLPSRKGAKEAQKTKKSKQKLLLDHCKTNASLKMEVEMTWLSGESVYKMKAAPESDHADSIAQIIGASRDLDDSRSISMSSSQLPSVESSSSLARSSPKQTLRKQRSGADLSDRRDGNEGDGSKKGTSSGASSPVSSRRNRRSGQSSAADLKHRASHQSLDPNLPQPGSQAQREAKDLVEAFFRRDYVPGMVGQRNRRAKRDKADGEEEKEAREERKQEGARKENGGKPSFKAVRTSSTGNKVALSGEDDDGAPTSPRPQDGRSKSQKSSFRSLASTSMESLSDSVRRVGRKKERDGEDGSTAEEARERKKKDQRALGVGT